MNDFIICIFYVVKSAVLVKLWFFSTGVHHGRVFPSDVDRRASAVRGSHRDPASQQPDGQQDLDSGYVFPKRQTLHRSQHDDSEQAVPHHAERNHPLHHEVQQRLAPAADVRIKTITFRTSTPTYNTDENLHDQD